VAGLAALNNGAAEVDEVSCASAGNCAAVGEYTGRDSRVQVFVDDERDGRWGKAIEVPGVAALNIGDAEFNSVSCASAGDCAAGGGYTDRHHHHQDFVVDERQGSWGTAVEVPGLGILDKDGAAEFNSVSCASAGNCVAGGDYEDRNGGEQGYVAAERNGAWGTAINVPGLVALNKGDAEVDSVSCASAGNCAAGGLYSDRRGSEQGFVAAERNGAWGAAIPVPGLAAMNKGEVDNIEVSCASPGNCAAGGDYEDRHRDEQGFVAAERNGSWGRAIGVPGLAVLNKDGLASVRSVSCAAPDYCAAGGDYYDGHANFRGFVVAERNGHWNKAIAVSGSEALNKSGDVQFSEVSCASPGNCAAGGNYTVRHDHGQGFVVVERNGRWTKATGVPGLASLNKGGDASADSVSCPAPGHCTAAGIYRHSGHLQGFVTQAR
jgi:hypothetical protein